MRTLHMSYIDPYHHLIYPTDISIAPIEYISHRIHCSNNRIHRNISMIIVGVDPGAKGCISILNTYSYREVIALPFASNSLQDIYTFLSEIRGGEVYRRAQLVSGKNISPKKVSPKNISPKKISPKNISPKKVSGKNISPKKVSSMKIIRSSLPKQVLTEDSPYDNTMEMWLEEPGQIVVNSRTKGKDATGALLAGMSSSRKLGRSVGQWEGIAAALNISVVLVSPKKWQSTLNCKTRGDKNISKNCAKNIFPFLTNSNGKSTITHDIADSLLIATYGYLQYADPKYIPALLKKQIGLNVPSNLSSRNRLSNRNVPTSKNTSTRKKPPSNIGKGKSDERDTRNNGTKRTVPRRGNKGTRIVRFSR